MNPISRVLSRLPGRGVSSFRHFLRGAVTAFAAAALASAQSTTVVISQAYGGGGNGGATYKNDFIELHNISTGPVSVNGWSVQYTSAEGTSWQVTALPDEEIPPGGYFLVQQAAGAGGTTDLPAPDATGTIAMGAGGFKVALVNSTTALAVSNPAGTSTVVDFVGCGNANAYEGTGVAPAPSNVNAVLRNDAGSTDTDNNADDFTAGPAAPRNSSTPPYIPSAGLALASLSPPDGATDVVPNTPLVMTFNRPVQPVANSVDGTLSIYEAGNPAALEVIDLEEDFFSVIISGSTVTVYPNSPLEHSKQYSIVVSADALEDGSGNPFAGIASGGWSFTTAAPDTTGPVPVTFTPAAGSSEASVGLPFQASVVFGELITPATQGAVGTVRLYRTSGTEQLLETLDPDEITVGGSNDTGDFAFDQVLVAGESYRLEVDANVFTDLLGNPNLAFSWTFTGYDISGMKVAINKILNNDTTDVVELLVIADGAGTTLNMEGMLLKDYSASGNSDGGGVYRFNDVAPWTSVRAGTLIVLTDTNSGVEDLDDSDYVIFANLKNTTLFTPVQGTFNIGNPDIVQIKVKDSPPAGSTGAIHTLSSSASASFYTSAPAPKVASSASGASVIVSHPGTGTPTANDFNAGVGGASAEAATMGLPNNSRNSQYIDTLRGTTSIAVSVANASRVVSETAGTQTDAITVSLSQTVSSDTTVTLSASPAGTIALPATVTIPAGSSSAAVSFTPVDDTVIAGNRVATITATLAGYEPGTAEVIVVEAQYVTPLAVVNKYQNGAPDKIELLVVQDGANLSGVILKDFSGNMGGDGGGKFLFTDAPLWQYLPSGTLIVLSNSTDAEPDAEDFDPGDFVVRVRLRNTTYFQSISGTLDVANTELVMLKWPGSDPTGVSGNMHSLAGGTVFPEFVDAGPVYYETPAPKLYSTTGGTGVFAVNGTSSLADFNGTDALGGAVLNDLFGLPNNSTNEAYINSLRSAAAPMAPLIVGPLTATGIVGEEFAYTIVATAAPTSYNATGLPAGLTVETSTGVISGTPTVEGTFNVTISATNGVGTATETLAITVFGAPSGGFASWLETNDPGGTLSGDHDGDGVPNGVEYFFGLTGSGFTPNPGLVDGKITWPTANVPDLTYAVQISTTLAVDSWEDVEAVDLDLSMPGFISYTPPAPTPGEPKLFIRFLVEQAD